VKQRIRYSVFTEICFMIHLFVVAYEVFESVFVFYDGSVMFHVNLRFLSVLRIVLKELTANK
jgi:hypothetical protein